MRRRILKIKNGAFAPNQIYFINDYYTGMLFLTANVDIKTKMIEIEYEPTEINRVKLIEFSIGNIQGDLEDIKILKNFTIENRAIKEKETTIKQRFSISNFKTGMKIVLWVNKVNPYTDFSLKVAVIHPGQKNKLYTKVKLVAMLQYVFNIN
jgi:hypothetical protein